MNPLDKTLRNKLENTVKNARTIAEAAAKASLEQLGVEQASAYLYLTEEERSLRKKLRIHGRQLGDIRDSNSREQEIFRLVEEVAYEHWHRMLFARFLAENNLLMYPDPDDPVAVSLEDCEELAKDEGAKDGWELAGRFAATMLPQIFRPDSPVLKLELPPENKLKLEEMLSELPSEVFLASDSLGWVYQYWQAKRKDEVNASEVKIGARELPAVTQLFTEPYMVSFLLDNSLGAWWVDNCKRDKNILKTAETEEILRNHFSLLGVPLEYLRFVKNDDGVWTPAGGVFDGWPKNLSELKTLDPCCGSGHFLVAALIMLTAMRIELDDLSAREAVDVVLEENLHGLEIDKRCVELAAFAIALTAWNYPDSGGYRILPELNIACSGLAVSAKKEEWLSLANGNDKLRNSLSKLYDLFEDAPVLGSLIDPSKELMNDDLLYANWEEVQPLLEAALSKELDDEKTEMSINAHGLLKVASLLSYKYYWVITNVPYLGKGKMNNTLVSYIEKQYFKASNDLATSFICRMKELLFDYGVYSFVSSQNWMFLRTFSLFRKQLLVEFKWSLVARLGYKSFSTQMYDFPVILNIFAKSKPIKFTKIRSINVENYEHLNKPVNLTYGKITAANQSQQVRNPQSRLTFDIDLSGSLVPAKSTEGLSTGDSARFINSFWEIPELSENWSYFQASPSANENLDGFTDLIKWEQGIGELSNSKAARIQGHYAWDKLGIIIGRVGDMRASIFSGCLFDKSAVVLTPNDEKQILSLYAFCNSSGFNSTVRKLDKKLGVATSVFESLPFDLEYWTKVAEENYPNGLPKLFTDDPTQWIFHGHPCRSVIWNEEKKWTDYGDLRTDQSVLQIAIARLLGYRWPAELDEDIELDEEQRSIVRECDKFLEFEDEDGIVCISAVRGEASAADRLLRILEAAYGSNWNTNVLSELLKSVGHSGKDIESWLRDKFFTQHCKMFKHRPFIWHIWDGLNDGFSALINYHKLDYKNLETLIYNYLGDWIKNQKADIAKGVDGAEEKLAAAENLKKNLELILEGENPYDIFVRWKPLEQQPISWNPDLNDGVRMNIRPFMSVPDIRKKGAGILRDKPNIKWGKDRGKDVESAPWYTLGLQYGGKEGDRINDHHLTLEAKQA